MPKYARPDVHIATQKIVGRRIKQIRETLGLSRAQAADLLGLDRSTLLKIESGTRAASIFTVIELSNRVDLPTDYILKGVLRPGARADLVAALASRFPELGGQLGDTAAHMGTDTPAGKRHSTEN